MRVEQHAALRPYNTLRVDARARYLVHLESERDVVDFLAGRRWRAMPRLILGGGSNVLLGGDFDGVVARVALRGLGIAERDADATYVRVAAGEPWHGVVQHTLAAGLAGLENLSLIPGTAGAAPIQNIGAYGVELGTSLHAVEAFDTRSGERHRLSNAECAFGYRDSVFKRGAGERFLITGLTLRLAHRVRLVTDYRGVREELARLGVATPTPACVARAVCNIRRRRLPDPRVLGNAGSFFKNPCLDALRTQALRAAHPGLPSYAQEDGRHKIPAAWLIEQCGWRGHREGDAGIHRQHALVLVNHGAAAAGELRALAERVRASVADRFGVVLETEPLIVGARDPGAPRPAVERSRASQGLR